MLSFLLLTFVALYAIRGFRRGLMVEVVDLVGLIVAILITAFVWPVVGGLVRVLTPVGPDGATALGVGISLALLLVGLFFLTRWVATHHPWLPTAVRHTDRVGGALFAGTWSVLLVSGLLLLAVTAPGARPRTAPVICESSLGEYLITDDNPFHVGGSRIAEFGRPVLLWISQRFNDAFTLGHDPGVCTDLDGPASGGSGEFRFPGVAASELTLDPQAEEEVLLLLNEARVAAGLAPLAADAPLRDVGRAHARDMYVRGFFAHDTPECDTGGSTPGCTDPFDRIRGAGISYATAGENLAMAPTSATAHRGLMESPGHRANILNPDFARVGIGVFSGPYGLMITQEFAG